MYKPLIVGWSPGVSTDPERPLENIPGSAGANLLKLTGLTEREYMRAFARGNLHYQYTDMSLGSCLRAREAAAMVELFHDLSMPFILCGNDVSRVFGITIPWHEWHYIRERWWARTPHPSGRNRWYNDPLHVRQAEAFWRRTASGKGIEVAMEEVA